MSDAAANYGAEHLCDGALEHDSKRYRLSAGRVAKLLGPDAYMHGPGDPSSGLTRTVFELCKRKGAKGLPDDVAAQLAGQVLGVTAARIKSGVSWSKTYTDYH